MERKKVRPVLPPRIEHTPPTFEEIMDKVDREAAEESPLLAVLSRSFEALFGVRPK